MYRKSLILVGIILLCSIASYTLYVILFIGNKYNVLDKSGIKYSTNKFLDNAFFDNRNVKDVSVVAVQFIYHNINDSKVNNVNIDKKINYLDDKGLISQLTSIQKFDKPVQLFFSGFTINETISRSLANVSCIQSLTFDKCCFENCSLEGIQTSPFYFTLTISRCTTNSRWIDIYKDISHLFAINLWQNKLDTTDFSDIFESHLNIAVIEITSNDIPIGAFQNINKMESLQVLNISHSSITQNDINQLVKLPKLQVIQFVECGIKNIDLSNVKNIPRIKLFSVIENGCPVYPCPEPLNSDSKPETGIKN